MSYASTHRKTNRKMPPRKPVRLMLAALAKRDANPLRIAEALKLAEQIKDLLDEFIHDVETGRDDPDNGVEGFKDTDPVRDVEHVDNVVDILLQARAILAAVEGSAR